MCADTGRGGAEEPTYRSSTTRGSSDGAEWAVSWVGTYESSLPPDASVAASTNAYSYSGGYARAETWTDPACAWSSALDGVRDSFFSDRT